MFISGGAYSKPYSVVRIVRGLFIGTILIAAIYGVLPNNLRYSKAMFILGAAIATFTTVGLRVLIHAVKNKNLDLGSRQKLNAVIVGNGEEQSRVHAMMMKAGMETNFMGFVSADSEKLEEGKVLGNIQQLDEIVTIYQVGEIIFCSKDVKSSTIIQWMAKIGRNDVKFKIVPEESLFIIGSDSSNSTGEFYSEEISFDLSKNLHRSNKRFADIGLAVLLILLGPFVAWYKQNPLKYFKRCFEVLLGLKTWIGYDPMGDSSYLPTLKKGVLKVTASTASDVLNSEIASKLNFFYAKDYYFDKDFSLLMKNLNKIGG
jgi:hypothetical protein